MRDLRGLFIDGGGRNRVAVGFTPRALGFIEEATGCSIKVLWYIFASCIALSTQYILSVFVESTKYYF